MEDILQRLLDNDSTLETLDLRGNSLGEGFGVAVARALERNTTLTKLNLADNRLRAVGGTAVAGALAST